MPVNGLGVGRGDEPEETTQRDGAVRLNVRVMAIPFRAREAVARNAHCFATMREKSKRRAGAVQTGAAAMTRDGRGNSSWASTSASSRRPAESVAATIPNTDETAFDSAAGVEPLSSQWWKNSAANRSPAPLTAIGSFGVRARQRPAVVAGQDVERVRRRVVERERGDGDDLRPARLSAAIAGARPRRASATERAGQPFELEGVRRDDRRRRQGAIAEEIRDLGRDIGAAADVADDGIAAPGGLGVGGANRWPAPSAPPRRSRPCPGSRSAVRRSRPSDADRLSPATHSSIMPASNARPRQPG